MEAKHGVWGSKTGDVFFYSSGPCGSDASRRSRNCTKCLWRGGITRKPSIFLTAAVPAQIQCAPDVCVCVMQNKIRNFSSCPNLGGVTCWRYWGVLRRADVFRWALPCLDLSCGHGQCNLLQPSGLAHASFLGHLCSKSCLRNLAGGYAGGGSSNAARRQGHWGLKLS